MKPQHRHPVFLLTVLAITCILAACSGSSASPTNAPSQPAAAILQAHTPTAPPVNSGFQGTVLDAQTGKPVANVYVVFQSADGSVRIDTFSDANGGYQIDLPAGLYRVIASHEGYQSFTSDTPFESTGAGYTTGAITLTSKIAATDTPAAQAGSVENSVGVQLGGFYWYIGETNLSCEAVCAAHGGYDEATKNFSGSSGTEDNCFNVIAKLEFPLDPILYAYDPITGSLVYPTNLGGVGCHVLLSQSNNFYNPYWDKDPTTAQAISSLAPVRRVCACQK